MTSSGKGYGATRKGILPNITIAYSLSRSDGITKIKNHARMHRQKAARSVAIVASEKTLFV
jgi:hypothetical protein